MDTRRLLLPAGLLLLLAACTQVPSTPPRPTPSPPPPVAGRTVERQEPRPAPPPAQPASSPKRDPEAPRLASRCTGGAQLCDTWVRFRQQTPWPYQTLGLRRLASGEYIVLVSEPPPTATQAQLDALLAAVFGSAIVERGRARFPTGIDGWLEDTLLQVRIDEPRGTRQVLSGHDLKPWSIPAWLAERLHYVHRSLHLTREGFYVDDLQAIASLPAQPKVPTVAVSARDVDAWLAPTRDWLALGSQTERRKWPQVLQPISPAVYYLPGDGLVALALPADVSRERLAEPLRMFGIASDVTVAAVRSKGGGLVLLGRSRQLPLTLLPPIRLETFMMLQRSRGRELGQSYERRRIFAGKLLKGPAFGWDWAPIFLSGNLEDSELGTLLNLADQVLKSWSQHGDVIYYAFDYRAPDAYPFGQLEASEYFQQKLQTTSLTFNWNTTGFSTWVDMPSGGIITPDRSSVLPITYIPGSGSSDASTTRLARDAADRAREVFAAQGDPLLARVAQHTLLFHALGTVGPPPSAPTSPSERRYRTDMVNDALRQQAERWLAAPEVTKTLDPAVSADIETLRGKMGLNTKQIAELLVRPATRDLSQMVEARQQAQAAYRTLFESGTYLQTRTSATFERMCREVNGTKVKVDKGERCNYQWPQSRPLPASVQEFDRLSRETSDVIAQLEQQAGSLRAQDEALAKEWERQTTVLRIVTKVAGRAGDTWDEWSVLRSVLENASRVNTAGAIQTPSVVLSRDSKNFFSVGGHNIGANPTRVVIGEAGAKPTFKKVGNDIGLVMSPEQLRASSDVVRKGVDGASLGTDRSIQSVRTSLQLEGGNVDAPLRVTVQRSGGARLSDAEVVERFAKQDCGTCIFRDAESNIYLLDKGPPTAVRTTGDTAELPGMIAGARNRETVRYEGIPPDVAAFISESVRVADVARATPIETAINGARRLFGKPPVGGDRTVIVFTDSAGRPHQFTLLGEPSTRVGLIKSKVTLSQAQVFDAGTDTVAWLKAAGRSQQGTVTVARFPRPGEAHIDLGVIADYAPAQGSQQSAVVGDAVMRAGKGNVDLTTVIGSIRSELNQRLRPQELEFFVRSNAGDIRVARPPVGELLAAR
jgi:hypothetical protein